MLEPESTQVHGVRSPWCALSRESAKLTYRVPVPRTRNEPKSATVARARVPPYFRRRYGGRRVPPRRLRRGDKGYACAGTLRGSRAHDGVLARGRGTRVRYGATGSRRSFVPCTSTNFTRPRSRARPRHRPRTVRRARARPRLPVFLNSARSDVAVAAACARVFVYLPPTWCGCAASPRRYAASADTSSEKVDGTVRPRYR